MRTYCTGVVFLAGISVVPAFAPADEAASAPRPVPLTRPQMKHALEDMKAIRPRIPLPEPTAKEQAAAEANSQEFGYESRLRKLYLDEGEGRSFGGFGGSRPGGGGAGNPQALADSDPALTLDYRFKTMLFWIASRANNCHY
jgi:hypothetical protein